MSQTKTRASRFGGRLFKSAATSALALSAVAGGVMLSGTEVKAVVITTCAPANGQIFSPGVSADCTTSGDPYVGKTFTNKATFIAGDIPTTTFVNLEGTGLGGPFSQQQIDTDFNGPLTGPSFFTSEYTVEALTPNTWFNQVDLSWVQVPGGNAAVSAKYDWVDKDGNPQTVTLTKSGDIYEILDQHPTEITVTNTYTPNNGAIDNVENTFRNVPGPLPILGAGAAFGFSRKLRSRIKASRTA